VALRPRLCGARLLGFLSPHPAALPSPLAAAPRSAVRTWKRDTHLHSSTMGNESGSGCLGCWRSPAARAREEVAQRDRGTPPAQSLVLKQSRRDPGQRLRVGAAWSPGCREAAAPPITGAVGPERGGQLGTPAPASPVPQFPPLHEKGTPTPRGPRQSQHIRVSKTL